MRDAGLQKQGEDFCWHAAYHVGRFVQGYQAWHDTAWLDWGVRYYQFLTSKLLTGADGYQGWIGPYECDNSVWSDVHVGDAILLNGLVAFAEVVLADPKLIALYSAQAHRYVDLARKHLFEKWDNRGTWQEDGAYGAYRQWNRFADPAVLTKPWTVRDDVRVSNLAAVALKLCRITGEDRFRDRAQRIFGYQKSRLQLVDDHYAWNYWEPYGASDIDLPAHRCKPWVGVHPDRPYQQGEVANIVEAYHTGVFDETDIHRLINTNLKVMWNGSREEPSFRSKATLPGANANPKSAAGVLWSALGDFDDTVHKLNTNETGPENGEEARRVSGKGLLRECNLAPAYRIRPHAANAARRRSSSPRSPARESIWPPRCPRPFA